MENLWFVLVGFLFVGYVLLDGYDLGTGAIHFTVAKTNRQRRQMLASIAPFWDANEVWLVTAGATLYFAFPTAYSIGFSGFYLPLIIVLWLLILRGLSIDLRNHSESPVWAPVWDFGFWSASALLALLFGVALGNVLRGVPLDSSAEFFLPLWTDFTVGGADVGIFDWYTLGVGVFSLVSLAMHGALWVNYKVEGVVQSRARMLAGVLQVFGLVLFAGVTAATLHVQPQAWVNLDEMPMGLAFPILAAAALIASMAMLWRDRALLAFACSALYLAAMLGSAGFTIYPYLLPSTLNPVYAVSIWNSNPGEFGLRTGLLWWIPGMALAVAYSAFAHWRFREKIPYPTS